MSVLSIHNLDIEVENRIRLKAQQERKSINQTVKDLLAESVGVNENTRVNHGADFEEFLNIWSEDDLAEFNSATQELNSIYEDKWK